MSDRELLGLAAKAAYPDMEWFYPPAGSPVAYVNELVWNPLTDDGDALRLAVTLHFHVMEGIAQDMDGSMTIEKDMQDPYAATRRAIVRAAAEIGRNMK